MQNILLQEEDKRYELAHTKNSAGIFGVYRVFLPQSEIFATITATENRDFIAKIGKEFSWFSFVTLFITFYGVFLYAYGMYNIFVTLNSSYYFMFILFLTLVTFTIGYWWFVNNEGESRLRSIYDE